MRLPTAAFNLHREGGGILQCGVIARRETSHLARAPRRARLMLLRRKMYELLARLFPRPFGFVRSTIGAHAPRVASAPPEARLVCEAEPATKGHLYAIERLRDAGRSTPFRHRYYCVRCRWSFLVNGRGAVKAVGEGNRKLLSAEAARRAQTFVAGPCPLRPDSPAAATSRQFAPETRDRRRLALVSSRAHAGVEVSLQHDQPGSTRESSA
ncbi:MAG: hypothetical protein IVW56_08750 [Candidatus Binataceae bacterium]|nr:hypothetical protein [Candidatus Binataceae bacterium]